MVLKDKIEILLESYEHEVLIACQSFFAMKTYNNICFRDKKIKSYVNKNARSWNIFNHSLQTTFFVSLARVFDESNDTLSVYSLMNYCMRNRREFSKWRLYRRKIRDGFGEADAREYVRYKHYPHKEYFKKLNKVKKQYAGLFKASYKDIRHQVFGHKIAVSIEEVNQLFKNTSISEAEDILEFLYKLGRVIRVLVDNGNLTDLCDHNFTEKDLMERDIENLLGDFHPSSN